MIWDKKEEERRRTNEQPTNSLFSSTTLKFYHTFDVLQFIYMVLKTTKATCYIDAIDVYALMLSGLGHVSLRVSLPLPLMASLVPF